VPPRPDPPLLGPAIATVFFVIVFPGTVVVWIPYELSGEWSFGTSFFGIELTRWVGAATVLAALPIFADFLIRFVREGFGTPAPIAPPRKLVVGGSFRYCRNPGYVAVVSLVVGQGLFFASTSVLIYAVCLWLAFHLFVVLYEEPNLRRRFGAEYEEYRRRVPRWIPGKSSSTS
jgi:protein-S-isoprenylcysteine O-methyltransferase Ste14